MTDTDAAGEGATNVGQGEQPGIRILAQFIRDLSFENPRAPESLRAGAAQPTGRGKYRPLARVDLINGRPPGPRPNFEDLTPLYPDQRLRLEDVPQRLPEIRKQPATMKAMIEVGDADVE